MPEHTLLLSRRDLTLAAAAGATLASAPAFGQAPSQPGGWFQMVLDHHREVEGLFQQMERAPDASRRATVLQRIARALTGHSIAEEVALYPMVAIVGLGNRSDELYREQSMAKVALARMDVMPKNGDTFRREFDRFRRDIAEHVADEERTIYPELRRRATREQNRKMTIDFEREFQRYAA